MNAGRAVRLGIAGCGRLAELGYVPALARLDGAELVAVADPDRGRRELVAAAAGRGGRPPIECARVEELIDGDRIDAVVVASPASAHPAHARLASEAGVACLVEKPPAADGAAAEEVAALPSPPWIGFNRRFQHAAPLLEAIPADGPISLELELRYRRASWRPLAVADEALLDLAPHLVDLTLLLSGAREATVRSVEIGASRAELELETPRGRAVLRCASDRPHRERVVVRDVAGRCLAASAAGGPVRALTARLPGREHPLVASLRAQLAAFARAVRGEDPGLLATADDGARAMRLIDAARSAAEVAP